MRLYTDGLEEAREVTTAKAAAHHNSAKKSTENVERDIFSDSESQEHTIFEATRKKPRPVAQQVVFIVLGSHKIYMSKSKPNVNV